VIMIHGLGASKREWEEIAPRLRARGFKPLCLDLLGHGESPKPDDPGQYSAGTIFSGFREWLQKQRLQGPISIVGHSLGGYLALKFTLEHPDQVSSLVLVDPFYKPGQLTPALRSVHRNPEWSSRALRMVPQWLIRTVLGQKPSGAADFSIEIRDRIATDLKRASPHILNVSATLPSLEQDLSRVTVPALVVWGKRDLTLQPDTFLRLVELMPNAVARPFAGCGHQPHLARLDVFTRLVADFLISPD
jgi:pimeloyl-ACP methyl ester carboxylesterase